MKKLNNTMLLFVWYLLYENKRKGTQKIFKNYEKDFIFGDHHIEDTTKYQKVSDIADLLEQDIITEVYIEEEYFEDLDNNEIQEDNKVTEYYFDKQNLGKEIKFNMLSKLKLNSCLFDNGTESDRYFNYFVKLNKKNAEVFIKEYLKEWKKNDGVYIPNQKNLKKEKQIEEVVKYISRELEKGFSEKNMLISEKVFEEKKEIDFITVMIYLENRGDIEIKSKEFNHKMRNKINFRIDIKEKFKDKMMNENKNNKVFYFNELEIDMKNGVLTNTKKKVTPSKDIPNTITYYFLECLIRKKGELCSYTEISDYLKNKENKKITLTNKEVMDKKSEFIKMLKEIKISASTRKEIIKGRKGYRINKSIFQ